MKRYLFQLLSPRSAAQPTADHFAIDDAPPLAFQSLSEIASLEDPFERVVGDLAIGHLINEICPVELKSGAVLIFATPEYVRSDQIEEVHRKVLRTGRRFNRPWRAQISATIIQGFVSGATNLHTLGGRERTVDENARSALLRTFNELVAWGVANNASDLHLNVRIGRPDSEVRYHVHGRYIAPVNFQKIPSRQLLDMLHVAYQDIKGASGAVFDPKIEQQGRLNLTINNHPILLRWASMATDAGPSVTMRILKLDEQTHGSLESLGYLPGEVATLERAQLAEGGAFIMAGSVGSGKSTTIATTMSKLPDWRKAITIEDPVEYLIPNALQNSVVRSLTGEDPYGFDSKLKTVKRSAMQDLLIGEIRDQETGRAFMDLVGSGTSVYTTVHANSVLLIPDRLASDFIGVSRDLLATPSILKLLVYQALLPKLCPRCSQPLDGLFKAGGKAAGGRLQNGKYWSDYARRIDRLYSVDASGIRVRNEEGCASCRNPMIPELNGLVGRTVVSEMLEPSMDDDILKCIKASDGIGLRNAFASRRSSAFTDPDMHGKSALECGVYKMSRGEIDPRELELRFQAFETVEMTASNRKVSSKSKLAVVRAPASGAGNDE